MGSRVEIHLVTEIVHEIKLDNLHENSFFSLVTHEVEVLLTVEDVIDHNAAI